MGAMEEFEAEHDWSSMRLMRKRNGIGAQSSGIGREAVREHYRGWALRKRDLAVVWLSE